MRSIAYTNAYAENNDFPGKEATALLDRIKHRMTKPMTHDEIVGLMDLQNPNAAPGYNNRMFHRLFVSGYFKNGGNPNRYLPADV